MLDIFLHVNCVKGLNITQSTTTMPGLIDHKMIRRQDGFLGHEALLVIFDTCLITLCTVSTISDGNITCIASLVGLSWRSSS